MGRERCSEARHYVRAKSTKNQQNSALQRWQGHSPSHFHLVSIPFQWLFLERSTGPTPEHLSNTWPGATDPRAKHQASAPSLLIWLPHKWMSVTVLLTFNASARASGQKWWQTTWNLRTYKAICDTNIKPCPPPKIWSQDHESKSRWISAKTR